MGLIKVYGSNQNFMGPIKVYGSNQNFGSKTRLKIVETIGNPGQLGLHFAKFLKLYRNLALGVFWVAKHESDISFKKFSTLGPIRLKILEIFLKEIEKKNYV